MTTCSARASVRALHDATRHQGIEYGRVVSAAPLRACLYFPRPANPGGYEMSIETRFLVIVDTRDDQIADVVSDKIRAIRGEFAVGEVEHVVVIEQSRKVNDG